MQRIVVLNPKGGSGKTTLAINLAAYFAGRGDSTLLIDRDPQGSSTRWLRKRKVPQALINGIATFERDSRTTMSYMMNKMAPGIIGSDRSEAYITAIRACQAS